MLNRILYEKRVEAEERKRTLPLPQLEERIARQKAPLNLANALSKGSIQLIAEVKKASPSRGAIRTDLVPAQLAYTYAAGGAAAISVLTDQKYFRGSLDDLAEVRGAINLPLLRKDFIVDAYQIYESRAYGADALLLIAAILDDERLKRLLTLSHLLGMQCLVEAHNETEVRRAVASGAKIIGINNRDLNTFTVDINNVCRLRPLAPPQHVVVGESGIKTHDDVVKLKSAGVNAILVGETLVTAPDTAAKIKELIS